MSKPVVGHKHQQSNYDDDELFSLYTQAVSGYGPEDTQGGNRTPTAVVPRTDDRVLSSYEQYDAPYQQQPSYNARSPSQYPQPLPGSMRSGGTRRPLPAPPGSSQPRPSITMPTPQHYGDTSVKPISSRSGYSNPRNDSPASSHSAAQGYHPAPQHKSQLNHSQSADNFYPSAVKPSRPSVGIPEVTVNEVESHRSNQRSAQDQRRAAQASDMSAAQIYASQHSTSARSTADGSHRGVSNGNGHAHHSDPRLAHYQQKGGAHQSHTSPTMLSPNGAYPAHEEGNDDLTSGIGLGLLRSSSVSSSLTGSLLQEPRRPSVPQVDYAAHSHDKLPPTPVNHSTVLRPQPSMDVLSNSQRGPYRNDSNNSYGLPVVSTPVSAPSGGSRPRRGGSEYYRIANMKGPLELDDVGDEEEEEELDELRFVNLALLSHIANRLKDKVPRGPHVKGGIPYNKAFTGKDVVSTIHGYIQKEYQGNTGVPLSNRRIALQIARSLQSQLFFYEVEWGSRKLTDGVEDVYMFLDEGDEIEESGGERRAGGGGYREELPTGVITVMTRCYSATCSDEEPCCSYVCPRKNHPTVERDHEPAPSTTIATSDARWTDLVDPELLKRLSDSEKRRQTIIFQVIVKEKQYVQDLEFVETCYINGLRRADPPVIALRDLEEFIEEVFGNISAIRESNRRLLDVLSVRQREQHPIIESIGDIFLNAAADFRGSYPLYVGHLPVAEKRIKDEMEENPEFRRFLEVCQKSDPRRLELKHFISRPTEHLQKYPSLLEAIYKETAEGNADADFLLEAEQAIRNLSTVAQLRTFQNAMGRGPTGKMEWHDLVSKDVRANIPKQEQKRQSVIWELIKGEMIYVKDLETIETLFIKPLRNGLIIPRERLPAFLHDVFHNFAEIHGHHRRMLDRLHEIQREEHPLIKTIVPPVYDAALNWGEAYLEYIPHYPIAAFRIDDEMANNPSFKAFIDQCIRHPDSRKLDLKAFINRPIPRLLRYELLLKGIMEASSPTHEDRDTIPLVLETIKDLGKGSEPGVQSAKQKVELWGYHANLVWKPGEMVDMDLLDDTRTLIYAGKLLRQPETGFEWSGWTELFVLLFDNYLVMTKAKEKDGITKYHVNRWPIPLDLLSLLGFNDPPQQKAIGLLRGRANRSAHGDGAGQALGQNSEDSRSVYPLQLHHNGRVGGIYTLYAETPQARTEWKGKLEEALGLRKVVQESNKVFEIETLSMDTFLVPSIHHNAQAPSWNEEGMFTGRVTCSVPFTTSDGRGLVAIGCAEGVWIGLRHDSKSMRRVLHLKMVTQCAMLEDFGIFLVLADKSLFAYHIEALVPSNPPSPHATRTPQKLNGNKDVQFFSVGQLGGRTLIIYMKKKSMDSVFRVLEPVVERITEKAKAPGGFGRFTFGSNRSEWFRVYKDFFLPSEAFDLVFLKARIAILCTKGFEIMDLTDFRSVSIPQRDDPRIAPWSKRLETCKPLGMFRCSENEFLLCYTEFGMYVNRHGDPVRAIVTVEWEGTAEKVAYHPPYVLLFDSRFIEIRNVETGRLVQIISGNDVRCLWDGRGSSLPPIETPGPDGWNEAVTQDARVHATMRVDDAPAGMRGMQMRGVVQHVFELLPTIPLYLPGSLASPSQSTYFPQSNSPPHSPRLRPTWSR